MESIIKTIITVLSILIFPFLLATCTQEPQLFLDVSQSEFYFTEYGDTQSFFLSTNKPWTIQSSANWCEASPATGEEATNEEIFISCEENQYFEERVCTITISAGEESTVISIKQKKDEIILFDDVYAKKVCVNKYDKNGDGELSLVEASLVTNINAFFFGDYKIAVQSFDELQYFTSLTKISKNAFQACTSLESITLPNSVISIEENAFQFCQNLSNIKLSDNLQSIGKYGIFGTKLSNLILPSSLVSIGDHGIAGNNLRTITIPESVKTIGYGILRSCNNLESIHSQYSSSDNRCLIIDGVLIGFAPYGIETYTFPPNINTIGKSSISGCKGPESLVISEGVTDIGSSAFEYSEVPTIFLPSTIKLIAEWGFGNYSEIRNLYCAATEPPIFGSDNFKYSENIFIYVPENSVNLYKNDASWSFLADKIFGYDF